MYLNDYFTVPMSLAGIPAISIPCGLRPRSARAAGLPVGLQLAGPAFSENRLLDAAHALEQAIGFDGSGAGVSWAGHAREREPDRCKRGCRQASRDRSALRAGIGLEIHVQLATATKMFCGCELSFGEPPNTHTCPVCLGLPGSLPVANARAVHFGLMIGLALGSELAPRSIFHRKNYFYPDLPKGYQISQYDEPLCRGGRLGEVRIHRVHLEEDAAKLIHVGASGRIHGSRREHRRLQPRRHAARGDRHRARPALAPSRPSEWLKLLRTTLRQLGVSDVNMEEGSLRCDANISLRPAGTRRARRQDRAEEHELLPLHRTRHPRRDRPPGGDPRAAVGRSSQETLHFDPASGAITSLRSKEEAHDYRYFPEPDLVPVAIDGADARRPRGPRMPELPGRRAPSACAASSA